MKKKWIVAIIAAILFAVVGIASISAGYLECGKCSCKSFYSKVSGTTCDKCSHSFSDHKR
ncbi:MAG: hypothetical protein FWB95_08405 [Treponema sp.]|nr:hypothetical protein [Treponema sp.]